MSFEHRRTPGYLTSVSQSMFFPFICRFFPRSAFIEYNTFSFVFIYFYFPSVELLHHGVDIMLQSYFSRSEFPVVEIHSCVVCELHHCNFGRSAMYMLNRRGPRTEPCDTPALAVLGFDIDVLICTSKIGLPGSFLSIG